MSTCDRLDFLNTRISTGYARNPPRTLLHGLQTQQLWQRVWEPFMSASKRRCDCSSPPRFAAWMKCCQAQLLISQNKLLCRLWDWTRGSWVGFQLVFAYSWAFKIEINSQNTKSWNSRKFWAFENYNFEVWKYSNFFLVCVLSACPH
jgi:hypothetical protein